MTSAFVIDAHRDAINSLFRIGDVVIGIDAEGVAGDQLNRARRSMGLAAAVIPGDGRAIVRGHAVGTRIAEGGHQAGRDRLPFGPEHELTTRRQRGISDAEGY